MSILRKIIHMHYLEPKSLFWFFLIVPMMLLGACSPIDGATPTAIDEAAPVVATLTRTSIAEQKTSEPVYTQTPIPTPTPTPTPELPVSYRDELPESLVPITASNLDDLELIATIGEGMLLSTHYNEENGRLVLVYSTGLDVYKKDKNETEFHLENRYNFDNRTFSYTYLEESDLYKVSDSTEFFVQDYGSRIRVVNLITGDEQSYYLTRNPPLRWIYGNRTIEFSPYEKYLQIKISSECLLIDLNSLEELDHRECENAFFSDDGDYYLVGVDLKFEIYKLPSMEFVGFVEGSSRPQFATIIQNQKVIAAFSNGVMVWRFPEIEFMGMAYSGSSKIKSQQHATTSDGAYFISANRDNVRIWDLNTYTLMGAYYNTSGFEISPDETHVLIMGKSDLLVKLEDLTTVASFDLSVNVQTKFLPSGNYFVAHSGGSTWVYDFEQEKTITVYENNDEKNYGYFLGASEKNLWIYINEIQGANHLLKYDMQNRTKKMYLQNSISATNMELYSNDFALIQGGNDIEIRDMENMERMVKLSDYRIPAYSILQPVKDYSHMLWNRQYMIDSDLLSSTFEWDVDYEELSQALFYIVPSVSLEEYSLYLDSLESPDSKYRVELGRGDILIYLNEDDSLFREFNLSTRIFDWAFSPDSNIIYISGGASDFSRSEWIRAYDISTTNLVGFYEYNSRVVTSNSTRYVMAVPLDVSPDGRFLATGNEKGQIAVLDLDNYWSVVFTIDVAMESFSDLHYSPDGSFITTAMQDDTIQFWESESGNLITELDILGDYDLRNRRLVQFYMLDDLLLVCDRADPWGALGLIKVYGVLDN